MRHRFAAPAHRRTTPLAQCARVALALLLAVGLAIPVGLTFAPQDAIAASYYTVKFYSDEMAFKTGLSPIYTYENEPEGTVITNPGLATPTIPDSNAHFLGWYPYDPNSSSLLPDGQPYDFSQPLKDDLTLVGRYRSDILVTFLDGYGKTFLTRQAAPGDPVTIPSDAEMQTFTAPSGYHFEMWMNDGTQYTGGALISDTTITPRLSTGSVFVFFVSAGTQVPFETVNKGQAAPEPDSPTRAGYTFLRWSTVENGTAAFNFDTPIADDTTLYAVWQANTVNYTVLFWQEKQNISGNPGTNSANYQLFSQTTKSALAGSLPNATTVNAFVTTQNTPAYSRYTAGDYTFSDLTIAGNGSTVLNIYFKRIEYTFTFTLAPPTGTTATMVIDGTSYTDVNPVSKYQFKAKVDQDISELWPTNIGTITTKDLKYHFNGWLPTGSGIAAVSKVFTLTSDLLPTSGTSQTVTGRWLTSGKDITLHYLFESLDGNVTGAVPYNGKFYLEDAAYTQTLFSGSTAPFNLKLIDGLTGLTKGALAKQGNSYVSLPSTASVDQYLFYDRTVHRLSFDAGGGTLYLNSGMDYTKIKFGASIASFAPSPPIKNLSDGLTYTFDGWYLDTAYHTPFDFSTAKMGNADIMLFAKWLVSEYTVTIYDDLTTAKPLTTLQRAQGEYVGDPETYTVGTEYPGKGTFEGWVVFIGPGATAPLSFDMPVTDDMAVHASWLAQTYNITYNTGSAASGAPPTDTTTYTSGVSARVMGSGTLVAPSTTPATQFIGWKISGAEADAPIYYPGALITVTGDITLDPVFEMGTPSLTEISYHPNYLPSMSAFTPPADTTQYSARSTSTTSVSVTVPGFEVFDMSVPGVSFHFLGWSTTPTTSEADDDDVQYHDGDSLAINDTGASISLYALWSETKHHIVRFDPGTGGTFAPGAQSIYAVVDGLPLDGGISGVNHVQAPDLSVNTAQYKFVGWSPAYSGSSVVYDDQVYVAQYEIVPPPEPELTLHVPVTNSAPTPGYVYVAPYEGVYDGLPHSVTVVNGMLDGSGALEGQMTFHDEPGDAIISWVYGAPSYTNVGSYPNINLAFTARYYLSSSLFSYVKITPRPITVTATHADIPLSSPLPDPNEYAVSVGNIVGTESFNTNQLTLSTNYQPDKDGVGTYQILADPGIFGNYELPDPGASGVDGKVVVGTFNVFDDGTSGVLDIEKAPATEQPLVVKKGDEVTYTITIANSGVGRLNDVSITEDMEGFWSDAVGFDLTNTLQASDNSLSFDTIPADSTYTVDFTVIAGEGTIANTVTGTSSGGGDTDTDTSITGTILDISKAPKDGQPLVVETGTDVTYTVTIRNLSDTAALSDVLITEGMTGGTWSNAVGFTLPSGGGMPTSDSFTIPTVAAGATLTVDYTVAATEGTNINQVTGGDNGGDGPNTDTGTNTDITGGILDIFKDPAAEQDHFVPMGTLVTYTITIRNLGQNETTDILSNVLVTEDMPGGTWLPSGLPNALDISDDTLVDIDGENLTIITLPANTVYTVNYQVAADQGPNKNIVAIDDPGPGDNGDTDTNTDIIGSVLEVSKALASGQSAMVKQGDEVTYTITVKNNGSAEFHDVGIVESMPGTWSNASTGIDVSGADITLDVPSIAAKTTFTVDYTVIADVGTLFNTVIAYSDGGGNTDLDVNTEVTAGVLSVEKAPAAGQPAKVRSGDEVTYTITLKNIGTMPVLGMTVTEDMPGGTWSNASGFTLPGADPVDGTLKADSFDLWWMDGGAVWTVDYTIVAGATEGAITNSVTATDGGPDGDPSTDDSPNKDTGTDTGITIDNSVGVLEIDKAPAAGQALNVEHGDPVTYTVTIKNSGTAEITDVRVVESLPGTWSDALGFDLGAGLQTGDNSLLIASLPAGAVYTVNYQIVAEAGTVVNTVTGTSGGDGGGGDDTDTDTSVHAGSLEITKKPAVGQPSFVKMGDPVTYTVTIRNLGTQAMDALTDVSIVEDMPGVWSDALGFDLGASLQTGDNSLLIDTILPGRTYTVNYTVTAGEGTIANTVTGTSDGGGGGDTDTNTDITGGVLDISKAPATGQPLLVEKGDAVTYTITIKNLGASTTLLDVLISETAGMPGGTWSNAKNLTLPGAINGELEADSFTIPTVTPGATLTVDYTVDAGEGTLANTVTGTNDGGDGPDTDTGTNTDIHAGILDIQKAPAAGQSLTVETGDSITYAITIKNLGENAGDDLSNVLVTESMGGGTWSNAAGFALPGAVNGELTDDSFTIPTVAAGATLTVDYTVAAVGGPNSNTVTAKNNGGGGDDGDTDTNTDVTANVLALSKTLAAGQSSVVKTGDTVTYTISAANSGAVPLTNVRIDEFMVGIWSNASTGITLPSSGTSLTIPSIAAGETFTVDYTVVADTNILVNTVSAFDDEFHFGVNTNDSVSAGSLNVSKRPADGQPLLVENGDTVVYTITIQNTFVGADLYDVLVVESMSGGTWSDAVGLDLAAATQPDGSLLIDTLPAGATYTVNYQIVAEAGTLANTVTATDGGGGGGGNTDTDTNTDVHAGSLEITKKPAVGQPGIVKMGDPVTYTITIRNLGTQATDALTDVSIVENMPGTWSDALGFDLGAALQPGDNSLLIDTILPGRTCTVNYTVIAGEGTIANTVTGTSDGGGGGDTDTNTDITGGVLDISKAPATGQPLLVETGDPVTYTITIKNLGTATTLLDVLISEAAGMPGGTWSNAVGFTLPGSDANGELTADSFIIPSVDAGATLTVDYTVDAGEGTLVNTVTGTDGGGGGPNTDTGTNTDIHAGILDVHKAPAAGQALTVETGDPVTYTITIRNLGENAGDDLSDVLVSEAAGMPGGTWSNAVGFTLPGADANGELVADSFIIPTVATGATLTVGYTVAATGGTLSNTVTVKDDGGTGGNGDTDTNTDVTANVLAISKALAAGQSSVVKMGDTVTYTISAANSGTTALTNVSIDEYMTGTWSNASTGITLPSSGTNLTVPSIGAGETFTVDYTVIADASILVNTVSAFDDEFHFDVDTNGIASAGTLGVSKRPADGQPLVVKKGDPVVYTITIHNTFMGTDLYDVLVTEGMGGGTWSNAVGFALPGADANGSLTADSFIIPTVAADATLTVDYTVAATEGVVTNTITVANDGGNGGYTDTDTNIDITGTPDGGSGGGGDGGGGDTGGGDTGGTGGGGSTLPASGDAATLWLIASALALLVIGTLCVTLNRRAARHRQAEETFHQGLKRHAE